MSEVVIERAQEIIENSWRPDRGLPTSPSHPDTFMTNTADYVETHLIMGNLDRALTEFELWKQSRYPSGFTPHYMLGSHIRAGVETNWIDARVQHTIRLDNGERVTPLAGPPNWAIAMSLIVDYMETNGQQEKAKKFVDDNFDDAVASSLALYDSRMTDGFIFQTHPDELTVRDGLISRLSYRNTAQESDNTKPEDAVSPQDKKRLEKAKKAKIWVAEDGVNGLLLENNLALANLAVKYGKSVPRQLVDDMNLTFENALPELIKINQYSHQPDEIYRTLGTLRAVRTLDDTQAILDVIEKMNILLGRTSDPLGPYEDSSKEHPVIRPDINLRIARLAITEAEHKPRLASPSSFHRIGSNIIEVIEKFGVFPRIIDPREVAPVIGSNVVTKRVKSIQGLWMPTVTEALKYSVKLK